MFDRPHLRTNLGIVLSLAGLEDAASIDQFHHEGSLQATDATHHEDILHKLPPRVPEPPAMLQLLRWQGSREIHKWKMIIAFDDLPCAELHIQGQLRDERRIKR